MSVIGIDLDDKNVFISKVKKRGKNFYIELISDGNKNALCSLKDSKVVTSIDSQNVTIRRQFFNIKSKRALLKALSFQRESITILDPEQSIFVPLIENHGNGFDVSFFVTLKESLVTHLEELKKNGIEPDVVSAAVQGLVNFSTLIMKKNPSFILHLGETKSICVALEDGKPINSYTLPYGVRNFVKIGEKIDLIQDTSLKLTNFRDEINKVFHSFSNKRGGELLITGGILELINLPHFLGPILSDIVSNIYVEPSGSYSKYAIAIGLALDYFRKKKVQFCINEFFPKKHFRNLLRWFGCFVVLTFSISAFLFGFINTEIKKKKEALKNQLLSALQLKDSGNLQEDLEKGREKLSELNREFSYFFTAPKVSQFIDWLEKLPYNINIQDLKYKLVKYPKLSSVPKDKLLVKVELEFKADVEDAKKFHEFLLKKSGLVNKSKDVSWEVLEDGYITTFYLKNFTLEELNANQVF